MAENVFSERLVEVEITNAEKQLTLVAPRATSTISITVSNLGGGDIVELGEMFGETYRLVQSVPCCLDSAITFRVFDGVWTMSVTNAGLQRLTRTESTMPPEPVSVAVTNGLVSVVLAGVSRSAGPTQQVQRVRTVTASGVIVSNASVSANSGTFAPPMLPLPAFGTPGLFDLRLAEGRWRLSADTASPPDWSGWRVGREIVIVSNITPSEVTMVFPESDSGPQIVGTIRT